MDMTPCRKGKFLVVSTFANSCLHICKQAQILAAKNGTICREGSPVIFHKWLLSRHLGNCFWISETVLVQTKCFFSVCSTFRLSLRLYHDSCQVMKIVYMRTTCSVGIQNMGLKLELNQLKHLEFIPFVFIPCLCWIWIRNIWSYKLSNTFNGIISKCRRYRRI